MKSLHCSSEFFSSELVRVLQSSCVLRLSMLDDGLVLTELGGDRDRVLANLSTSSVKMQGRKEKNIICLYDRIDRKMMDSYGRRL